MDVLTAVPPADVSSNDPYAMHRLALLPLRETVARVGVFAEIDAAGPHRFFNFLARQGLEQLWREYFAPISWPAHHEPWRIRLLDHARATAAHQMIQREAILELARTFQSRGLDWFLFKGADLRGWLYADPTLRPVSDIDLFVRPRHCRLAIESLTAAGYTLQVAAETASHEVTLQREHVTVDLHWHLFRPGRARRGLGDWLFERIEPRHGIPGLDATASLLVMLVHPAITKYLLSPTSMLIHAVDQARLIRCGAVDWQALAETLTLSGTQSAAWSSLYVLRNLTGVEPPDGFTRKIQPGRVRRRYLQHWIDRAWITKYFDARWLVAGFFSLALQDNLADAARALYLQRRAADTRSFEHTGRTVDHNGFDTQG